MLYVVEIGEFKSSHFDFREVNFDTMKLFHYANMAVALMPQGFWDIEKSTMVSYQNHRAYMVELRGIEPLSESNLTRLSPGAVCYLHSLCRTGTNTLTALVAS